MSLRLIIKKRKAADSTLQQGEEVVLDLNQTVADLKQQILNKFKIPIIQQWVTFEEQTIVLDDDNKPIRLCNLKDGQTLLIKDLGPQMPWSIVFYQEYLGPIVVMSIIYLLGDKGNYSNFQKATFLMGALHFIKRIIETKYVHIFSRASMPFKRAMINSFHYWILFGFNVGVELFLVREFTSKTVTFTKMLFLVIWIASEYMNYRCHDTLSKLRTSVKKSDEYYSSQKHRAIPHGNGFDQISCANYFWEICAWLAFSAFSECYTAWIFTIFSGGQMIQWAKQKHQRYRKDFGDKYPRNRKALIPFII